VEVEAAPRSRIEAGRQAEPDLGGDVHVVWEKFCRYFDVEPRIVPLQEDKYTIGPEDVEPHVDESTIGIAAVLGTTFTGHADDIVGINKLLVDLKGDKGLDVPLHIDGASGAFVWPFLYPDSKWDFRLEQVRSINVSGHKFGLVYPGIGWLVFREKEDLAEDLVFYENYLGKTDATFTLNFSTGASMVLAQYYNFVRYGFEGYAYIMRAMQENARSLADKLRAMGDFELIGDGEEQLPLVALQARRREELRRVRPLLAALCRARLDAPRLHDAAQRRRGEGAACPGQADAQPRAGRSPRRRHRPGLRDAGEKGWRSLLRAQAGQDRHRLLSGGDGTPAAFAPATLLSRSSPPRRG
jgi:glutamate decarboxylase